MYDCKKLFALAKKQGIDAIELVESADRSASISLFNGQVDKTNVSSNVSRMVRALKNGKMAYVDFENPNEDERKLVETLVNNIDSIDSEEESFIYPGDDKYPEINNSCDDFSSIPTEKKIELLKTLEADCKKNDKRIVAVPMCMYNEVEESLRMINSLGLDICKTVSYAYCGVQLVAKDGEDTNADFEMSAGRFFKDLVAEEVAAKAVKKVTDKLGAKPCKSGEYKVIIDSETMSELFGAFSVLFCGDMAMRKLCNYNEKIGEKIFSDKISVIDDPLHPDSPSSQPFDDEGVACRTKTVVENGVLKMILHNLKTAKYFNAKSTGNGFKKGGSVGTMPCNMYIKGGEAPLDDMIKSMGEGVLITSVSGLHAGVNPTTGDFSLQSSGFMIRNGEKAEPLTLIVLSGNFNDVMKDVVCVGNDLKVDYKGVCTPSIEFGAIKVSGL
ncbi:MAG: TldD/PmbA family protein [Clostridia bacterium]|nr:TldD/PmbA family protein [Clostridia bacterium]